MGPVIGTNAQKDKAVLAFIIKIHRKIKTHTTSPEVQLMAGKIPDVLRKYTLKKKTLV